MGRSQNGDAVGPASPILPVDPGWRMPMAKRGGLGGLYLRLAGGMYPDGPSDSGRRASATFWGTGNRPVRLKQAPRTAATVLAIPAFAVVGEQAILRDFVPCYPPMMTDDPCVTITVNMLRLLKKYGCI